MAIADNSGFIFVKVDSDIMAAILANNTRLTMNDYTPRHFGGNAVMIFNVLEFHLRTYISDYIQNCVTHPVNRHRAGIIKEIIITDKTLSSDVLFLSS